MDSQRAPPIDDPTLFRFQEVMMRNYAGYPQEQVDNVFKGYEDVWMSRLGLYPESAIPALPPAYIKQYTENRIVYVTGFVFACDCRYFLKWARNFADIETTITILDLASQCNFRWLIATTALEAQKLLRTIHLKTITMRQPHRDGTEERFVFTVLARLAPWRMLLDPGPGSQSANSVSTGNQVITVHGHPSPPIQEMQRLSLQSSESKTGLSSGDSSIFQGDDPEPASAEVKATSEVHQKKAAITAPSWASLAKEANPDAEVIDLHPPNRTFTAPRIRPAGRTTSSSTSSTEQLIDQSRVVFLLNLPQSITLQQVSDAIQEGPLRSINFGVDAETSKRYAGVVFQHAHDAETFYQLLCKERADSKPSRFKFVVDAIRGDPFPMDDTLTAMGSPTFASRRLTLVKSKFFFMVKDRDLRSFCEKIVAPEMIQLIWLYNGGNATIVFSDVSAAIKVKKKLDDQSNGIAVFDGQNLASWLGLQTTFSKDPCVAPLELKTAMAS